MTSETGSDEEFAERLRVQICAAFDVKPWQIGIAPAPWYLRPAMTYRRWRWRIRCAWSRLTRPEVTEDDDDWA